MLLGMVGLAGLALVAAGCGGTEPNVIAPNVRPRAVNGTTIPDSFPNS